MHVSSRPPRLAVVTTHPIQYQAPLFRALHASDRVDLHVLFASMQGAERGRDPGFGVEMKWDVPLLDGYLWSRVENRSKAPDVSRFSGTDLPAIGQTLAELEADAVLIPGWGRKGYVQAWRAARRLGIPLLMRGEARLIPGQPLHIRLAKQMLVRPFVRSMDAWLPIGTRNREFYRACAAPEARYFYAPYFVDNAFFAKGAAEREAQSAETPHWQQAPDDSCVFLFVGKLIAKKRPSDVIHAFRQALRSRPSLNAKLLVVGDGPLRQDCENAAGDALEESVHFTGFLNQSEITRAYAAADVLVLPSDYDETWGLVVNEAMASGLAAIVSERVGCAPDLVIEGETGYTVAMSDIEQIADRMVRIADRPELRRSLQAAAKQKIAGYTVDRAAEGVLAALAYTTSERS